MTDRRAVVKVVCVDARRARPHALSCLPARGHQRARLDSSPGPDPETTLSHVSVVAVAG